jgi:hypothetical protein
MPVELHFYNLDIQANFPATPTTSSFPEAVASSPEESVSPLQV